MPKAKVVLLSLLVVFGIYAIASASASAHTFIIEGKEVGTKEKIAAEGTSGTSTMVSTIGSTKVTTVCKAGSSTVELEEGGKAKGRTKTSECSIIGHESACHVREPIEDAFKEELVIFKEKLAVKEVPVEGEVFTDTEITGATCSLKGSYAVTGSQISELPGVEAEAVEHEIVNTPAGSALRIGSNPMTLENTGHSKLASGKKWSAK